MIVVGTTVIAELLDRTTAELLRDHIDQLGVPNPFRRGIVITHEGWVSEAGYISNNPVIAIGGPPINELAAEFDKWVAPSSGAGGKYRIAGPGDRTGFLRENQVGLPQVGLWGKTANDTRKTVEHYLEDEHGLSSFLKMCWK